MPRGDPTKVDAEIAERCWQEFDNQSHSASLYQNYQEAVRAERGPVMICSWLDFAYWLLEREAEEE